MLKLSRSFISAVRLSVCPAANVSVLCGECQHGTAGSLFWLTFFKWAWTTSMELCQALNDHITKLEWRIYWRLCGDDATHESLGKKERKKNTKKLMMLRTEVVNIPEWCEGKTFISELVPQLKKFHLLFPLMIPLLFHQASYTANVIPVISVYTRLVWFLPQ